MWKVVFQPPVWLGGKWSLHPSEMECWEIWEASWTRTFKEEWRTTLFKLLKTNEPTCLQPTMLYKYAARPRDQRDCLKRGFMNSDVEEVDLPPFSLGTPPDFAVGVTVGSTIGVHIGESGIQRGEWVVPQSPRNSLLTSWRRNLGNKLLLGNPSLRHTDIPIF